MNSLVPIPEYRVPQEVSNAPLTIGMPSAQELMVYQTWAKNAVESQMYRSIGKESGVMMIMLAAREYGIGPAQALNGGLHIIEGKVELSARVMSALIRRAKHVLQIIESTDEKCTIKGRRYDTNEMHTVTYTIDMAQKAGLVKDKGGWKRNPEDMLYARCMSRLARQLFSDVIGIGYIEGEISDSRASNAELEVLPEQSMLGETFYAIDPLYESIDPSDHHLIKEFITVVADHFKWSEERTIREFLADKKSFSDKFYSWKSKRKVA